ncbi:MAG: hypothetical protein ABIP85_12070 [Chthoniobacteraceae bacterium]
MNPKPITIGRIAPLPAGSAQPAKSRLTREVNERLAEHYEGLPIWVRPPKGTLEYYTGLSRSKLYALEGEGSIRGVSIREPGALKGMKLFHLQSILDYIERCEREANDAKAQGIAQESVSDTNGTPTS